MLIKVSDSDLNESNMFYLQNALSEVFAPTDCAVKLKTENGRSMLSIDCPERYASVVRAETADKVAELIAVKYKYDYFKKSVKVQGLSAVENEIMYASLISADLVEDKKYCYEKLKNSSDIVIDGVFNFRFRALKEKWRGIAEYMPPCFISSQLKDFIKFLLENKRKKAYVDCGKVYDWYYRRLKRADLLDGETAKITREIILSGCGEVEISGKTAPEDEFYLKEYYGDKIIFSTGYFG